MENLNAEQVISELDFQTKLAKFTNSNGVLTSVKCAQFVLDYMQRYEQRIKELTEENERLRADTIDEFADMVKEKMREVATGKRASLVGIGWLDQIAKELKGEG